MVERMTLIPAAWKTASNTAVKLASRSCRTSTHTVRPHVARSSGSGRPRPWSAAVGEFPGESLRFVLPVSAFWGRVRCQYSVTVVDLRRLQPADVLMLHPRTNTEGLDITEGDIGELSRVD